MRPQQAFLDPGTSFAHYRVDSVIGRGGMGVVYLAHDVRLDRKVALKLLAPEYTSHENFRARFLRESRLAAAVDHPNIIPIYEAGDAEGQLFLAMRYVPGPDLRAELHRRTRLPLLEALDLLHQVADALDAAHAAGLVHRDVKPGNVLVDERSRQGHRHAYLTDFGLTRRSTSISGLTTSGHFLGTLDYVAPEQIRGDPVDGRADVYSFACVAYAVLAGRPPFDGEDDVALMWAHLSRVPPRAAVLLPELAGNVDEALAAGLAKAPEDRPATCGALVALMASGTPAEAPAPRPPGPRSGDGSASDPGAVGETPRPRLRRRRAWALAAVAALVAVAVVVGVLVVRGAGEEVTTFAADGVPYTLEVPEEWVARVHDAGSSSVTVLSPTDLTPLFSDDPDGVRSAAAAVDDDPTGVVGLAIYHRPRLDGDTPAAQLPAAQALLPGPDADLRAGQREAVGDLEGSVMVGTLGLGADASLQVRVLALDSAPRQLLVFFAPPSVFAERVQTFDRIARSLDGTGG